MTPALRTGREYLRVSFDRFGRQKSHGEQHDENVSGAETLGVTIQGEPYSDTGSASRHARKRRDDFHQLLDDLAHDRFGAEMLVLWESSRGSRKVGEWVELIELCEKVGVKFAVTTHRRIYDPANPRDRRSLLEDAVDSEYESAKTSERIRRDVASAAAKGRPHGAAPFGYRRIYSPATGELIRQERDPDEAPIVEELFERLEAGDSLAAISRDFEARGFKSRDRKSRLVAQEVCDQAEANVAEALARRGGHSQEYADAVLAHEQAVEALSKVKPGVPFSPQTLRTMALTRAYAGRRVHTPGRADHRALNRFVGENDYEAKLWDGLVSEDRFQAVTTRLTDPTRRTSRPGRANNLLSMFTQCDACGGPLSVTYRRGPRQYQCHGGGHVVIDADGLDRWAEQLILQTISDDDLFARLAPQADPLALAAARDEVARVKAEHSDLANQVSSGKLSATLAAAAEPGILARLHAAEAKEKELSMPAELRSLILPGPGAAERWRKKSMTAKRQIARLMFAPGALGILSVTRRNGSTKPRNRVRLDGRPLPPVATGA